MGTLFTELFSSATSSSSGSLRKNKELSGIRVHAFDRHTQVTEAGRSVTSKPVPGQPELYSKALSQEQDRRGSEGKCLSDIVSLRVAETGGSLHKVFSLLWSPRGPGDPAQCSHSYYILELPEPHPPLEPEPGAASQNPPQKGRKQSQWQVFLHARVKARLDTPYSST